MIDQALRCLLISNFNLGNLRGFLQSGECGREIEAIEAPYGQVLPIILSANIEQFGSGIEFAIVWTQPASVVGSFGRLERGEAVDSKEVEAEVDQFVAALDHLGSQVSYVLVPTWVLPTFQRGLGLLDLKNERGVTRQLMMMNLRLAQKLEAVPNIYVLDAQRWIAEVGPRSFNSKLWYLGKIPFSNPVFKEAATDIVAATHALRGEARKLVVLDLDDTIWGGIVGETGWEGIRLGGHDAIGEAYVDFQRTLKGLRQRGVVLGIVSKNEESVALEAIREHPEMILGTDDFVGWRINWNDKAQNIIELVAELNLGLQSTVFIDDNPAERDRVRQTLPEVLVPDWPEDPMQYRTALERLRCFDLASVSSEDEHRTQFYVSERERRQLRDSISSVDDWLSSLEVEVKMEKLNQVNLSRAAQLLNKTNQMNLRTRRMADKELMDWSREEGRAVWVFRVSDRFGDSGLTGLASLQSEDSELGCIVDFILSCRVFGRHVENAMLRTIIDDARNRGLARIQARYVRSAKNKPCFEFFSERSGFHHERETDTFGWSTDDQYPAPASVKSKMEPAD